MTNKNDKYCNFSRNIMVNNNKICTVILACATYFLMMSSKVKVHWKQFCVCLGTKAT